MGIEITTKAEIPPQGVLRRRPSRDKVLAQLETSLRQAIDDLLILRFAQMGVYQHTLSIMLHPAGAPLELTWTPEHTVEAWVKTSTAGPGYHHFVIELLNGLRQTCGLDWNWDGADETDYAITWNYESLQHEMARFLQQMARQFIDYADSGHTSLAVNMPLDRPRAKSPAFVVSPMGRLSKEWWLELGDTDGDRLLQMAEGFYPWWGRETDAMFYRNAGKVLMWCDVPWHPPGTPAEREVCEVTSDCFARASALDPSIDIPQAEANELQQLLAHDPDAPAEVPKPEGIGYRREMMTWPATGEWTIDLPGYFYEQLADDDSRVVLWFNDRTVHLSSLSIKREDGQPAPPREMLPEKKPDELRGAEVIDYEEGHLAGWATIRRAEEDGEQYWELEGTMAACNTVLIVTICYLNPDGKQWAINTFKSLFHPEPE